MSFIRIITFVFFLIASAQGYCIYNHHSSATISVTQVGGYGGNDYSRFHQVIKPSDKACCPYTTKDCCSALNKDGYGKFQVYVLPNSPVLMFPTPCGGYAVISGTDSNLDIQVYDSDGNQHPADVENAPPFSGGIGKVHGNRTLILP